LRDAINKLGKPILLFEGGKSLQLNSFVIKVRVESAMNIMKYLGIRSGDPVKTNNPIVVKRSKWIRAPHSELFESVVENGSFAPKNPFLEEYPILAESFRKVYLLRLTVTFLA
jgi:predicted deacylase